MRFHRSSEKGLQHAGRDHWTAHLHAYPSTVAAFLALNDDLVTGRYGRDARDERERW